MIQPYEDILKEFDAQLASIGFCCESVSAHGASFRRTDGLRLLLSVERHGEGFSVELLPTGASVGDGYAASLLMETLAPDRARKSKKIAPNQSAAPESIRLWWREFCGFLKDEGSKNTLNPMPPSLKARYDAVCAAKMRAFGLE